MQKTPAEMIRILPDDDFSVANAFVALGEALNCKSVVRYATAHKSWKCVYSRKKPARVLYTIECTEDKWHIKACLWSIDAYREAFDACSDTIKGIVTSAYDCKACNQHCAGGAKFSLGGILYKKCMGCSFHFSNLSKDDWRDLVALIAKEHQATDPAI